MTAEHAAGGAPARRARIGFLGAGWIGRSRLEALAASGLGEVAAVADPSADALAAALGVAPEAAVSPEPDLLFESGLDGVVIATPSAQHAEQAVAALERGLAVFCQKPLGRDAAETRRVVDAARAADRLLAVDFSYRHVDGVAEARELARSGALGRVFAASLVFHNAYGPDKSWYYDRRLSGGGCLVDLGIHLVDLALWTLDFPRVVGARGRRFARGEPLGAGDPAVEDYVSAALDLESGAVAEITCSWNAPAGRDAVIEASFFGTGGGVALRNLGGSFYDFEVERREGTRRETIATCSRAWGGGALLEWVRRLSASPAYDPDAERIVSVAEALDAVYAA